MANLTDLGTLQGELEDLRDGEARDVSGSGNNGAVPGYGTAQGQFVRLTTNDYEDGIDDPRANGVDGSLLPSTREISNAIADQDLDGDGAEESLPTPFNHTQLLTTFGQFVDHGLDFMQRGGGTVTITVPADDPQFDVTSIAVGRGAAADGTGTDAANPREQTNTTSSYVDMNQIYGSHPSVTYYLRESVRDENGDLVRDADGLIVKDANLLTGALDVTGRPDLPTYADILLNNGVAQSTIDAAVAANDFTLLEAAPGFIDFRNVPLHTDTTAPFAAAGANLLNGVRFDANPSTPTIFNLSSLLAHQVSGDGRLNENVQLTTMHTIFVREHNFQVAELRAGVGAGWTEEELFQTAKIIVEAEEQRTVFGEFLDAMVGGIGSDYSGYDADVDASISHEFAQAVYRVGHSMISEFVPISDPETGEIMNVTLEEVFTNPAKYIEFGTDSIIAGNLAVAHQTIDHLVVNAVRNQLGDGTRPSDLAAINIVRGREVGLASLNDIRRELFDDGAQLGDTGSDVTSSLQGLEDLRPYATWAEFAANLRDPSLIDAFKAVYGEDDIHVNDVDLWIGGLAEKPIDGSQVGPTFTWIMREQFDRLRDGDRFYYEDRLAGTELLTAIEKETLADIIMRNTGLDHLADEAFTLSTEIRLASTTVNFNGRGINEVIIGNGQANKLVGNSGDDTLYGEAGDDVLNGFNGDDGLRGGDAADRLNGGNGDDRLIGGFGVDQLAGDAGRDSMFGGSGDDNLAGGDGNDRLYGEEAADIVRGGAGNDELHGGRGADVLTGGTGADIMDGGAGLDRFVFAFATDSGTTAATRDIIVDFQTGVDKIDLQLIDARPGFGGNNAFVAIDGPFTAAGQIRLVDAGDGVTLLVGTLSAGLTVDFAIEIHGSGAGTIVVGDILL